jgi:hypothetical protein
MSFVSFPADRLYSVTEGWISALYLFMLELIAQGSFTPAKNIYGIFERAVYMPLAEEIKEFILSWCIFDSFTYEQALHMWGEENTDEDLCEITDKNAFVTYDVMAKTNHMHNIFTGYLREVLERKTWGSGRELYRKAASKSTWRNAPWRIKPDIPLEMQTGIIICAMFVQMRLAFIKGDLSGMLDILQKMYSDVKSGRQYMLMHTVDICEGHIYSLMNQKDKVPAWITAGAINSSRLMFPAYGCFNIVYGRTLLINGEYLKLMGSAEQFISITSVFPNLLGQIYTYIYLAAANKQIFREQEAISVLKQALGLAMPDRVYLPFAEN